nr:hypothetical protein [Maliibacterium massiliense]
MKKTMLRALTACAVVLTLLLCGISTAMAGEAPLRLAAQTANEPGVQIFTVTNPNAAAKNITWGDVSGKITKEDVVPAGGSITLRYPDAQMQGVRIYVSYTLDDAPKTLYAIGANKYNITVQYMSAGTLLHAEKVSVGGNYTHSAPATFAHNGKTYQLASAANQTHVFGKSGTTMTFEYNQVVQQPYEVSVAYVDGSETKLGGVTLPVAVGATATHDVPKQITAGGRQYELMVGQPTTISHAYGEASRSYKVYYALVKAPEPTAYNVNVQYVDAAGNMLNYKRVTIPVNETVRIDVPARIATANGSRYTRAAGEPDSITHAYANTQRTYSVRFDLAAATEPYTIAVNYLSSADGATLASQNVTVNRNSTATFEAVSSFEHNGITYHLAAGQNRNISHPFAASQRVYNFYYNAQGQQEAAYAVTLQYVNIADNIVLFSTQQRVESGQTITLDVPATYSAGGTDYKLVSGQGQRISHAFYLPRRVYSVFYQNAADTTENTVITDNTTGQTTIITPGGTTNVVTDNQGNIVEAPPVEEPVNIDDIQVPASDTPEKNDGETVEIPEVEVPAAAPAQTAADHSLLWWIVGGAALLAAGILTIVLVVKRKKAAAAEK